MTVLKLIPPGASVQFVSSATRGTVSQIAIGGNLMVQYQVIWWSGDERKQSWVESHELDMTEETIDVRLDN